MAETVKVVDGKLQITTTGDTNVVTKTSDELIGEKAEIQTKIDHLNIDKTALDTELADIQTKIDLLK